VEGWRHLSRKKGDWSARGPTEVEALWGADTRFELAQRRPPLVTLVRRWLSAKPVTNAGGKRASMNSGIHNTQNQSRRTGMSAPHCTKKRGSSCSPLPRVTPIYLLVSPDSAWAVCEPIANAYFLPEKRISFSDLWPSGLNTVTAESRFGV